MMDASYEAAGAEGARAPYIGSRTAAPVWMELAAATLSTASRAARLFA